MLFILVHTQVNFSTTSSNEINIINSFSKLVLLVCFVDNQSWNLLSTCEFLMKVKNSLAICNFQGT